MLYKSNKLEMCLSFILLSYNDDCLDLIMEKKASKQKCKKWGRKNREGINIKWHWVCFLGKIVTDIDP